MSRRSVPSLVAALSVTLALVACGSSDDGAEADASTSTSTTATTTTTTTTAPAATEPPRPSGFTATARDAVNELEAAWETGDQARARNVAPGAVVDALFLVPADGYSIQGCDTGEFETSYCNYRNRSTGGFITVESQRFPEGWQVVSIDVNAD